MPGTPLGTQKVVLNTDGKLQSEDKKRVPPRNLERSGDGAGGRGCVSLQALR